MVNPKALAVGAIGVGALVAIIAYQKPITNALEYAGQGVTHVSEAFGTTLGDIVGSPLNVTAEAMNSFAESLQNFENAVKFITNVIH